MGFSLCGWIFLAPSEGFEPPTPRSEAACSDPLSYEGTGEIMTIILYTYLVDRLKTFYSQNKNRIDLLLPIFYLLFLLFLLFGFFQIRAILNTPDVDIEKPPKKEKVEERDEKEINVNLQVIGANGETLKSFVYKIENKKTIDDYLQEVRREQDLSYEKVQYLDGIRIEKVMDLPIDDSQQWQVYAEDQIVTKQIEDLAFIDDDKIRNIKIVLEPKN